MKRVLLFSLCMICLASNIFAAPDVDSTSGNFEDGENVIITGTGFGTNVLDIEWLGGADGNIEQGADGEPFTKTKWATDAQSSDRQTPVYTTTKSHSGSKSILSERRKRRVWLWPSVWQPGRFDD